MISTPEGAPPSHGVARRLGPFDVLVLSAWCGLVSGELEVGARIAYAAISSTNRLYSMTRHFVWLVPLIDLLLFATFGVLLAFATRLWPRPAGWLSPRLVLTWAILPVLIEAGRRIHIEAWLIVAMGIAACVSRILERHLEGSIRRLARSLPVLLGIVLLQAGWIFGGDRLKLWREETSPLPPTDSPDVLLVVLDTVRADHLGLYGYERPTSPNLERLAARGIRFDRARAAAPWTLASHANMFTGRWPHELEIGWMKPMRGDVTTVAEFLGSIGYATAGFVGNTFYCSYDSGLGRGFTHYEDYVLDPITAVRTVHLIDLTLKTIAPLGSFASMGEQGIRQFSEGDRKSARDVNREFLGWLSRRRGPRRPFFAFLNYADAHAPYLLPAGEEYRFGSAPDSEADVRFLSEAWTRVDKRMITRSARRSLGIPTTTAWRTSTGNWANCSTNCGDGGCSIRPWSSWPPITAKAWGSTSCSITARASTVRKSGCLCSSFHPVGEANPRRLSTNLSASATSLRPSRKSSDPRPGHDSRAGR